MMVALVPGHLDSYDEDSIVFVGVVVDDAGADNDLAERHLKLKLKLVKRKAG
jgi:hypothetical protein